MKRSLTVAFVAGLALASASPAAAVEIVDDDKVQCPSATHTTIQSGVDAASPNEQVQVCNGIYREQVTIAGPGKAGVDVLAKVIRGATIKAPNTDLPEPRALVHIDNASGAKIRRFIISGPGNGTVDSLRSGVLVENNADPGERPAQVLANLIQDIRDTQAAANENGDGVRVGRAFASTVGRATVNGNEIVRYQKTGVTVDGNGSFALVSNNTIRGLGLVTGGPVPAQQGIQIGRNAAADVNTNRISDNRFSGSSGEASFGILVFNTDRLQPNGARSRFKTNTVFNNDFGIFLQDARNQVLATNRVTSNGDPGAPAPDGGIGVFETGPGLGGGNTLIRNEARTNEGLDCEDGTTGSGTAGTGNTWTGNRGVDDVPAGICTP